MTLHLDDARWRAAVEADLLGEATPEQKALLASHEPQGAEHRAEQNLLAALAHAQDGADDLDEEAVLEAVVGAWASEQPIAATRRKSRAVPLALAAVVGAAAAAIVATVLLTRPDSPELVPPELQPVATKEEGMPPSPPSQPPPPEPIEAPSETWTLLSGTATLDGQPVAGELPTGVKLLASAPICAERKGTRACLGAASSFEATTDSIALFEGEIEMQSETAASSRLSLGELAVEPAPFTTVVVQRSVAGWSVRVDRGQAEVIESRGRRVVLAGETLERAVESDAPAIRAEAPSANELLRLARSKRRSGDTTGALATYEKILRRHPKSATARIAAVSVGQLRLSKGDAKGALKAFRRYLGGGAGALSEDAAYGEIRALRALGRTAEAKQATSKFLKRYPESHYGAKLEP